MDQRKLVFKDTAAIAVGEFLCSGIMLSIFAGLGKFEMRVLWSALAGCTILILNYLFMAITVNVAADRAQSGEVDQAKKMVQTSSAVRLVVMGILLFLGIKLGANLIALVLPLIFVRPILMLSHFFGKKGE